MYCITDAHIDYMLDNFRARGITLDSLQQDLLDHVCCIIEQNLEETGDFEHCYAVTIATFYKEQLGEIEVETKLLLTFKNHYTMKKVMIASGILSVFAFITGSFFKLMHWPFAGILLFFGIVIFCFIFLPLMLLLKLREAHAIRDKLIFGLATLLCITYFMSMLFKVEHWPGATALWYFTLFSIFFLFIPVYFFTGIRKPETKFNTIVTTILLIAFTGIQFTMTALRKPAQETVAAQQVQSQEQTNAGIHQ